MDLYSILGKCLNECICYYDGVKDSERLPYRWNNGFETLESKYKVKDYLVGIIKCINKHVFNEDIIPTDVEHTFSDETCEKIIKRKYAIYSFDKKELYFKVFDALKEFHDNYVYGKKPDVVEDANSQRPIYNKKFDELEESEFARDYFLFMFVGIYVVSGLAPVINRPYAEYVMPEEAREYYKEYMGNKYHQEQEIVRELTNKEMLKDIIEKGFEYEKSKEDEYSISGGNKDVKKVAFPALIGLEHVREFSGVFNTFDFSEEDKFDIEEVTINSIKSRIYFSFNACPKLKKITVDWEIIDVDECAFSDCELITTYQGGVKYIKINDNSYYIVKYLQDPDLKTIKINENAYVVAHQFSFDAKCEEVDLGNIKYLGDNAFEECANLKKVIMSKSLKTIGEFAFSGCVNLSQIDFPDSLEYIGAYAFDNTSLKRVSIPGGCVVEKSAFPEDCIVDTY